MLVPNKVEFLGWNTLQRIGYLAGVAAVVTFFVQISIWAYGVNKWSQDPPSEISAADKLVIDQNPTKVDISDVSKEPFGSNKEAVFLTLKNRSSVTARNVRIYLYNHEGSKMPIAEPFANGPEGTGVGIPAGENRRYRIGYVDEYEKIFYPEQRHASLLRVSTKFQDEAPFELETLACGVDEWGVRPCTFRSTGISTLVNIRYGSIFGQKYNTLTQFYNTFLIGEVDFLEGGLALQ